MPELIAGAQFEELFRSYRYTAWRLETRSYYGKADEEQPFQEWLAGRDPGLDWFTPWLQMIQEETARGKHMARVRLMNDPPSDYQRWELWGTPYNLGVGEDIRYLPRNHPVVSELPDHDFWIFDCRTVAPLHFDEEGRFLGVTLSEDPTTVLTAVQARDAAWHHALTYTRYLASRAV
ncbi:hypothetical protein RIF23_00210 [Lipingzhangella sp. LS1_29]|uniref:DUF6879 domain-containing protein n=1 Tax=Lipingzhangella rawalii TaxID=2055835 RepID=A0ABU2H066_9ACTN|nr:DUF6879 family protein [Lipingzhangella rawalii]MDS1268711.1 hypothetical protein [Lipingzhangella rawalii]